MNIIDGPMPTGESRALQKAERMAAGYNLVLNLFWTLLNLVPAVCYFYTYLTTAWLWIIVPVSLLPYFLPAVLFDRLSAGNSRHWYQRLGVHLLLDYVQQGRFINRMIRKRYPTYRVIHNQLTIRRKINQTYMFERFHLGLLLDFFILTGHALTKAYWLWVAVLLLCNFVYNVYPILLQQYIRLRLGQLRR